MTALVAELPRVLEKGFRFREKLVGGEMLSGAWSTLGSPDIAYLMARAGLDYILVDLEHGRGGIEAVAAQVQAILSLDTAVMVRLPDSAPKSIGRILDAGANILLAPSVDTLEEALEIRKAALFWPEGNRGVAVGAIAASDYGYEPVDYFKNANAATSLIYQVESPDAIENLADLAERGGADGFFIGPNDLSTAMGIFRDYANPRFLSAIETIEKTVKAAGKALGCLPFPGMTAAQLHGRGVQLAPGGSDQTFLRSGAGNIVKATRGGAVD